MATAFKRPIAVRARDKKTALKLQIAALDEVPAAHQPWGPELWPDEVRDNLDEWPPKFRDRELISEIRQQFSGEKRVVLLGKHATGKSTLAAALHAIYTTYRSDDCQLVQTDGDEAPHLQRSKAMLHSSLTLIDLPAKVSDRIRDKVLEQADHLVIVTTPAIDAVFAGTSLLDELNERGYGHLAENSTVALNRIPRMPFSELLNIDRHFSKHCLSVVRINSDPRVGDETDSHLDGIKPSTRTGLFELAAAVATRAGNKKIGNN